VKSSDQTELEGVIVGINSDTQWLGGFVLQNHSLLPPWLAWLTTAAAMLPHPFRHHLPDLRKHGCRWKRAFDLLLGLAFVDSTRRLGQLCIP